MKLTRKQDGTYRLKLDQAELQNLFEYVNNTEVDADNPWHDDEEKYERAELNRFGWDLFHLTITEVDR